MGLLAGRGRRRQSHEAQARCQRFGLDDDAGLAGRSRHQPRTLADQDRVRGVHRQQHRLGVEEIRRQAGGRQVREPASHALAFNGSGRHAPVVAATDREVQRLDVAGEAVLECVGHGLQQAAALERDLGLGERHVAARDDHDQAPAATGRHGLDKGARGRLCQWPSARIHRQPLDPSGSGQAQYAKIRHGPLRDRCRNCAAPAARPGRYAAKECRG